MKSIFFFIFHLIFCFSVFSQTDTAKLIADTPTKPATKPQPARPRAAKPTDTSRVVKPGSFPIINFDSVREKPGADSLLKDSLAVEGDTLNVAKPIPLFSGIDSFYARFLQNPFLPMDKRPVYQLLQFRDVGGKDNLFYLVAGLVFYLAFIKFIFGRYYSNMFRLFFQPSFRQKQTREQLMQNNFPSLLLNLFFVLAGGLYLSLVIQYFHLIASSFWQLLLYSTLGLTVLYLCKYLFLSFSGWVFNVKEASGTYIFIVYLINKILGVLMVPFILIVAFSTPAVITVSVTISLLLVVLLFIYRFVVAYIPVRREIKVSQLHFSLYILAFEILPLLCIYKSLILYLGRTL